MYQFIIAGPNLGLALNHILVWDQIELKSKTKSYLDQGPKSYLGPGPNAIWVWDQIEFGSWTKSYLGLDPN